MAYNEALADKLRELLEDEPDITEKKMFGGVSFLASGKMTVGVIKDDLCVRAHPDNEAKYLEDPAARPMDFTKSPMKGWIYVNADGWDDDETLAIWVSRSLEFVRALPDKPARKPRKKPTKRSS